MELCVYVRFSRTLIRGKANKIIYIFRNFDSIVNYIESKWFE